MNGSFRGESADAGGGGEHEVPTRPSVIMLLNESTLNCTTVNPPDVPRLGRGEGLAAARMPLAPILAQAQRSARPPGHALSSRLPAGLGRGELRLSPEPGAHHRPNEGRWHADRLQASPPGTCASV